MVYYQESLQKAEPKKNIVCKLFILVFYPKVQDEGLSKIKTEESGSQHIVPLSSFGYH